ncbi:hypothetical protein ACFWBC_06350 [Streptomyces sp. NPDC059985]|uniref:hypothetical protein n=1 Tax=Streptomyces sp. NPDC059985 TaxID=3347025 RepID=UPI0036BC5EF3
MTQLAVRLGDLASSGTTINFETLGLSETVVNSEVAEVASGPYAPLLAEAITHALEHDDHTWDEAAARFSSGFARQPSVLHLTSALETLLASTTTAKALARPLSSALLTDLDQTVQSLPLLAAARLEGAVRLAVSKAVSPIRVWGTLEELDTRGPEDFLERLPRILGLALDCWSQDEQVITEALRALLKDLAADEAGDVDAFVELGCDELRSALSAQSLAQVSEHTTAARTWFNAAEAAEEARHDAQAYAAVCDAVLAFTAGDSIAVSTAAENLEMALQQRDAWHWGMHQPAWLQPQLAAEVAWGRLILRLRRAAELLAEDVWMEPWQALDDVLSAYSAARTVRPLGPQDGQGLALLVEPAVEDSFLRNQALLAQLRRAAAAPEGHPGLSFDRDTAVELVSGIDRRVASAVAPAGRESRTPATGDTADDGPSEADLERAHRFAPTTVTKLGIDFTAGLAQNLSDDDLVAIDGLTHTEDLARLRNSDPVVVPLLNQFLKELSAFPDFVGETRRTFSILVEQTLLFLKAAADLDTATAFGEGRYDTSNKRVKIRDYRRRFDKADGDSVPLENDLQQHFHYWLLSGQISGLVQVEPINQALGRADILVHFSSRRYLTEIKKTATKNTREYLEGKYIAQAAEYSNTNSPFSQLLVLDLTEKLKAGTLRLNELAWVAAHCPPGASINRAVVVGVVTGNRYTPSDFS